MSLPGASSTDNPLAVRLLLWLGVFVAVGYAFAQELGGVAPTQGSVNETERKANFIGNFAHYVTWPEGTFENDRSPIVIGAVGEDPIRPLLAILLSGRHVNQRELLVRMFDALEDVEGCHILFVGDSVEKEFQKSVSFCRENHVLLVSELENAMTRGGVINLFDKDGRTRFQIQLDQARRFGLRLDPKLLRLAKIVRDGRD